MHELCLYGQVAAARHEQVLKILAGIAALPPKALYERQLVFKPLRAEEVKPNKKQPNKPVKPATLTYHQVIEQLSEDDFGKPASLLIQQGLNAAPVSLRPCTLKVSETPEPETKTLVLRQVLETELTAERLGKILDPDNYGFVVELIAEGHRLVHKDIILSLFRLLRADNKGTAAPSAVIPSLDALIPLDPSGCFILEARVRIDDRTKPVLFSTASEELFAFRDLMKGSVHMTVPERLSLDTRVK